MIPSGDKVDAAGEHFFGSLSGQPKPACGVLAIGDAGMDLMLLSKQRYATLERLASRGADHVPDNHEVQARAI